VDAAPYFRIFNSVTPSQVFGFNVGYARQFTSQIASLSDRYLFNSWQAPQYIVKEADVKPGTTNPIPVVDLKQLLNTALEAFESLKREAQ